MAELVVWGSVPVGIHVDTESGDVTRIVVIDEELKYPDDIDTPLVEGDLAVATDGYQTPWGGPLDESGYAVAREDARKALEIARAENTEFPAWQFGY